MSKKIVAMLMAVAMAFSLLPVTAFATGGPSATTTKDVVDGYYNDHNQWVKGEQTRSDELQNTVTTVNKTAKKVDGQDNQYEVTLKVEMKHKKTAVPPGAAATVLVIDTSGSMEDDTKCSKEEHVHDSTCYTWEACTQENHPLHYVWWKGEYVHIPRSSCKWDGNKYVYQRLICNKEAHKHGKNCETTSRIEAAKVAAKNFLNSYRGGTVSEDGRWTPSTTPLNRYVSIVSFNKYVSKNDWVDVSTKDGYNAAIASINDLSADGGTNLDAGLRMANAQLKNDTVKNMPADVVVLTDGKPTYHLEKAENQKKDSGVEIEGVKYSVKGYGYATSEETYDKTVSTATTLKQAASVYTVCFGASNEKLEAKDKPTVSKFLRTKIATQAEGKTYAYDANDTTDLYKAFAAISSSVVSGLNTGTVTDALPAGVSCTDSTFDEVGEDGTLTWDLKAEDARQSVADNDGFITYTYEKTYKVQIDPAAEGLNVEDGYVPLNLPTKLTVKNSDNRDVEIPFPIPAGKVTYSLTDFEKALVTNQNKPGDLTISSNITIPNDADSTVTVGENGVTLLYKITVKGDKGAKFTVTDDGATLVSPKDDTITTGDNSTFSGTVGNTGTTVFYVSKQFTQDNIEESGDKKTVSNTATIDPGDNAKGPADDKKTKTVTTPAKEPDPQTYTVTYQWADENRPSDATLPTGNPFILNVGDKHTVADVPQSSVKTNAAGETGTWSCRWDKSGTIEGTANQKIVITGTWQFTKDQPKTGNLIVKKVVSGDGVTLNDLPNITITVAGTGTNSTYSRELTLATQDTAEPASTTVATWTISDLPAGEYTVSEENAGVDGYDCTAEYASSNETDTEKSVTVTENQTSTMTVTNKYTKQEVVPPTPADPVKLDVSRSKIASDLTKNSNGDWTTDVTLGLPSATKKQTIDVVLVVDNAFPKDNTTAATQAAGLMEQLEKIAKSGTVSINTGLVISGGYIPVLHRIELGNIEDNITNINEAIDNSKTDWKQQEGRKGSNIQAGVETARQMLAGETSASKENKYLVLISDGGAFSWYENGTSVSKFYSTETDSEKPNYYWCNPWDFQMRYGDGVSSTEFDFTALMGKPETEVDANSIPCPSEEWPSTGNGQNGEENQTQYQSNYSKATVQSTLDKYPGKCAYDIVNKEGYITSREAALYHTAKSISMASNEVKVIFVSFPYNYNNGSNLFKLTEGFKQYVADNNDNVTLYRVNGEENYPDEYKAGDSAEVFKSVKKDLIYLVDKGSKVEDTIGNKFTLIPDSFKLTVGGTKLQSIKAGETYYFGDETVSTTVYKFKVTVTKTESETKFDWDINEAITKDKPVKLTYTLKLTDPKTGTYGVTDLNGDGIVDGTESTTVVDGDALYTNESATMVPKDSNGKTGAELTFPKPSVFYTISSSGSHSGGSRPSLNTKDHYGYIIGYPVDYYTGQPTTDQTKKPVRPEGKITRAEVATIYFRMLTDESRTKFWSQSNAYSDVKTGDWFNNAVSTLSNAGIIAGYEDGSFRPNGYITRAEFATIAARFFDVTYNGKDLFPDISGHWAKDYINQAANKGFVNGYEDGTFKPDRNITRAEAVTLVNRTLDRHPDKSHFTKDMLVWPDNMDQTKWYYADMQEATNSHTYQMKENSDKTKYENWTKTLPIRNWEALEKAWSNANSSQGNGNVV